MVLYICEKFHNNISNSFQLTEHTGVEKWLFSMFIWAIMEKIGQTRVIVHVFCKLFHSALHLCEVSRKYRADTST